MIPEWSNFALFMLATVTLNITPGPDLLYVIAQSIGQGRAAGVVSSLGISTGCLVHTAAVTCGITGLFILIPAAYDIVRFAGAAYLIYLGIRVFVSPGSVSSNPDSRRRSLRSVFWQGAVTNILNPKVALFFLAFLPQFVDKNAESVPLQMLFLGLMFIVSGTIVCIMVALLASRASELIRNRTGASGIFKWLSGSVFIGLGLRLAFMSKK